MAVRSVKVFAPATVANVAVGFDHLGFAIDRPGDEVLIREGREPGLKITKIIGDNKRLPRKVSSNTAGVAGQALLKYIGEADRPLEMEIRKRMPFGSGMGSSAASAAAAVYAVHRYCKTGLDKRQLLQFAVEGEQVADGAWHADNVAPSLLGGVVLIRDNASLDLVKLHVPKGLRAVVMYPHVEVLTRESRSILSDSVSFGDAIKQAANAASFTAGMFNSDLGLIKRSLTDLLVEPQRKHLIPLFDDVKKVAHQEGALGCSISGAGPSIFALCDNTMSASNIKERVSAIYADAGIQVDIYDSLINQEGAVIC